MQRKGAGPADDQRTRWLTTFECNVDLRRNPERWPHVTFPTPLMSVAVCSPRLTPVFIYLWRDMGRGDVQANADTVSSCLDIKPDCPCLNIKLDTVVKLHGVYPQTGDIERVWVRGLALTVRTTAPNDTCTPVVKLATLAPSPVYKLRHATVAALCQN
jgi:hypothetical protein